MPAYISNALKDFMSKERTKEYNQIDAPKYRCNCDFVYMQSIYKKREENARLRELLDRAALNPPPPPPSIPEIELPPLDSLVFEPPDIPSLEIPDIPGLSDILLSEPERKNASEVSSLERFMEIAAQIEKSSKAEKKKDEIPADYQEVYF